MKAQDPATAVARYEALLAELQPMWQRLARAPTSGNPSRFLDAASWQGRLLAQRARQLAQGLRVPDLREAVLKQHLLLHAHSAQAVFLLSLKHQRQLNYLLPGGPGCSWGSGAAEINAHLRLRDCPDQFEQTQGRLLFVKRRPHTRLSIQ